jgi:hypothetical protein
MLDGRSAAGMGLFVRVALVSVHSRSLLDRSALAFG